VLVRVLGQVVARSSVHREGTPGELRPLGIERPDSVVERLRPSPEPVDDVGEHRDG
jgi:hypothetical protein